MRGVGGRVKAQSEGQPDTMGILYQCGWRRERVEGGVGVGRGRLRSKELRHQSILNNLKAFKDFGRSHLPTIPLPFPPSLVSP